MTAANAGAIVLKAYQDAQKVPEGGSLSPSQLASGIDRLNDLVNLWQTQGLKLFLEQEVPVTLVAGVQTYDARPGGRINMTRPLQAKSASYVDSFGNSRPLDLIGRSDWTALSQRSQQGSVNQFYPEKLADRLNINLWNVPDTNAATGSLLVVFRVQTGNYVNSSDALVFPIEWTLALRWAIADEVCFGQPEPVQARCQSRAQAYRQALEDWDVEEAETTFQPDGRYSTGSRFR